MKRFPLDSEIVLALDWVLLPDAVDLEGGVDDPNAMAPDCNPWDPEEESEENDDWGVNCFDVESRLLLFDGWEKPLGALLPASSPAFCATLYPMTIPLSGS